MDATLNPPISQIYIQNIIDLYKHDHQPLVELLFVYMYTSDFALISDKLNELKILDYDQLTVITRVESKNRKQNFSFFNASVRALTYTGDLSARHVSFIEHWIIKEEVNVMSAIEVFCLTNDRKDYVDSLMLIYEHFYDSEEFYMGKNEDQDDDHKISQRNTLFKYKERIEPKYFDHLLELIKCNDKEVSELHSKYMVGRHKDTNTFVIKLNEYARSKYDSKVFSLP